MTHIEFTAWVHAMRDNCGWSQAECARQLGVLPGQIVRWMRGDSPHYIDLACEALARAQRRFPGKKKE